MFGASSVLTMQEIALQVKVDEYRANMHKQYGYSISIEL